MSLFFFKQKTAYEMRISDWSSDVCSSDLLGLQITNRQQMPRPVGIAVHMAEHDRGRRPQADGMGGPHHLQPLGRVHLVRTDDRAHFVVENLGSSSRQGFESFFLEHCQIGRASWRERGGQYV